MKKRHIFIITVIFFSNIIFGQTYRPKIGLTLSGGGALGLAHIGILEKIDSLEIPIDYLTGTSMGGLMGALYAYGYSSSELLEIINTVDWASMFSDSPERSELPYFEKIDNHKYQFDVGITELNKPEKLGLIEGQTIENTFAQLTPCFSTEKDFDKLQIPFRCMSVDILTGNEVVMSNGSLSKAMRSTMSVPSAFTPVEYGDSLLIDGGVLNNMPVDIARNMGADFVLAVSVRNPNKKKEDLRGFLDILRQSYNIIGFRQIHKQAENADLYIECMIANLSPMDFTPKKTQEIINIGRKYANENLDKLIKMKEMIEKYEQDNGPADYFSIDTISVYDNIAYRDELIVDLLKLNQTSTREELVEQLNFLKDTLALKEVKYSFRKTPENNNHLCIRIKEKTPKLFGVYVYGNKIHSFGFIYRLLGIKPGTKLDVDLLNDRINYLYSLGYFKKITYDLDFAIPGYVKLNINVIENPRRKIRFGLRYDNQYDLVAAISAQYNNAFFPGLRLEDKIQFLGYTKLAGKIYYPSRTLNIPIYPFIKTQYSNKPYLVYLTNGEKIASYNYNTFNMSAGLGLLYKNFEHLQAYVNHEYVKARTDIAYTVDEKSKIFEEQISSIKFDYNIDLLDDYLYPKNGIYIEGHLEKADDIFFHTDQEYLKYYTKLDFYYTILNTFILHMSGAYYQSEDLPDYKHFWIGGPDDFIGVEYDQLLIKEMLYIKPQLSVEVQDDFRFSMIYNQALSYESLLFDNTATLNKTLSAWGTSFEYNTAVGPFKLIISKSIESITDKLNHNYYIYFTAGYRF